jgi:hypothetical protein
MYYVDGCLLFLQVTKGNQKKNFFTIPEYLEWNETYNKDGKWHAKYYKVKPSCIRWFSEPSVNSFSIKFTGVGNQYE